MMRPASAGFSVVLLLLAGGCASPQGRVEQGLRQFGVPERPAECMARELDERLSRRQMDALAETLEEAGEREQARPGRILELARRLEDPQVADAAARASVACALLR